jgi:hypothetical protein
MSKKSLAIGLVLLVIISLSVAYFLTDGFISIPQLDGSVQFKVEQNGSYIGIFNQQLGDYKYFFVYHPNTIDIWGQSINGSLQIWREDVQGSTDFPLTTNISHDYYGMTFTITQVKPEYIIIMAKSTL